MEPHILLCLDSQSQQHPELAGLPDEAVCNQPWCMCLPSASLCRAAWRSNHALREAWFVSSDDMEPINAAAALKRDDGSRKVYLVSGDASGSSASRAKAARLDGVWDASEFLGRYAECKRLVRDSADSPAAAGVLSGGVPEAAGAALAMGGVNLAAGGARLAAAGARDRTETGKRGCAMAVVSGSGGSGKSTVSSLMALIASQMGIRTALLDADLQFGDVCHLMGSAPHIRLDALCAASDPSEALAAAFGRARSEPAVPAIVSAPLKLEDSEIFASHVGAVLDVLRSEFELTVVNTGAFWCETHAMLMESCDRTVVLMDQRPSSLRACVHALDLCGRMGVASRPFVFAINRCERSGLLSSVDASCALHGAHVMELPDGGRDVDELLGAGYPLELIGSKNPFVEALKNLTEGLVRDSMPEAAGRIGKKRRGKGLFRKRKGGK